MIIRQRVDPVAMGNMARVARVLGAGRHLYVDVWQTLDATEPTVMRAVNQAVEQFITRVKNRRGYGTEEGSGCV